MPPTRASKGRRGKPYDPNEETTATPRRTTATPVTAKERPRRAATGAKLTAQTRYDNDVSAFQVFEDSRAILGGGGAREVPNKRRQTATAKENETVGAVDDNNSKRKKKKKRQKVVDESAVDDAVDDKAEDGADGEKSQHRDDGNKQQNQPTTNRNRGSVKKSSMEVPSIPIGLNVAFGSASVVENVGGGSNRIDSAGAIGNQLVDGNGPGKCDGGNVGVDAAGNNENGDDAEGHDGGGNGVDNNKNDAPVDDRNKTDGVHDGHNDNQDLTATAGMAAGLGSKDVHHQDVLNAKNNLIAGNTSLLDEREYQDPSLALLEPPSTNRVLERQTKEHHDLEQLTNMAAAQLEEAGKGEDDDSEDMPLVEHHRQAKQSSVGTKQTPVPKVIATPMKGGSNNDYVPNAPRFNHPVASSHTYDHSASVPVNNSAFGDPPGFASPSATYNQNACSEMRSQETNSQLEYPADPSSRRSLFAPTEEDIRALMPINVTRQHFRLMGDIPSAADWKILDMLHEMGWMERMDRYCKHVVIEEQKSIFHGDAPMVLRFGEKDVYYEPYLRKGPSSFDVPSLKVYHGPAVGYDKDSSVVQHQYFSRSNSVPHHVYSNLNRSDEGVRQDNSGQNQHVQPMGTLVPARPETPFLMHPQGIQAPYGVNPYDRCGDPELAEWYWQEHPHLDPRNAQGNQGPSHSHQSNVPILPTMSDGQLRSNTVDSNVPKSADSLAKKKKPKSAPKKGATTKSVPVIRIGPSQNLETKPAAVKTPTKTPKKGTNHVPTSNKSRSNNDDNSVEVAKVLPPSESDDVTEWDPNAHLSDSGCIIWPSPEVTLLNPTETAVLVPIDNLCVGHFPLYNDDYPIFGPDPCLHPMLVINVLGVANLGYISRGNMDFKHPAPMIATMLASGYSDKYKMYRCQEANKIFFGYFIHIAMYSLAANSCGLGTSIPHKHLEVNVKQKILRDKSGKIKRGRLSEKKKDKLKPVLIENMYRLGNRDAYGGVGRRIKDMYKFRGQFHFGALNDKKHATHVAPSDSLLLGKNDDAEARLREKRLYKYVNFLRLSKIVRWNVLAFKTHLQEYAHANGGKSLAAIGATGDNTLEISQITPDIIHFRIEHCVTKIRAGVATNWENFRQEWVPMSNDVPKSIPPRFWLHQFILIYPFIVGHLSKRIIGNITGTQKGTQFNVNDMILGNEDESFGYVSQILRHWGLFDVYPFVHDDGGSEFLYVKPSFTGTNNWAGSKDKPIAGTDGELSPGWEKYISYNELCEWAETLPKPSKTARLDFMESGESPVITERGGGEAE